MSTGGCHEIDVLASAVEVLDGSGRVKDELLLLPVGTFTLRDGRGPYTVADRAHAEAVVRASLADAGRQQMHFDWEHALLHKASKGEEAPAAAWVKRLFADDQGVKAQVEWTARARTQLEGREYRYISPFFRATASDGRVTRLINAALTNNPAIDGLPAIAASQNLTQEPHMKLSAIAAALGMSDADKATEDQVVAAASSLTARLKASVSALGLTEAASAEEIVAASAKLKKGPKEGEIIVPASVFDDLQKKVNDLAEKEVTASVDEAIKAGKITPGQREDMLAFAKAEPARFASFIGKKEQVVSAGVIITGEPKKNDKGLTETQVAAAARSGLTEDEYIAAHKQIYGDL